jgi:hypothetical protein
MFYSLPTSQQGTRLPQETSMEKRVACVDEQLHLLTFEEEKTGSGEKRRARSHIMKVINLRPQKLSNDIPFENTGSSEKFLVPHSAIQREIAKKTVRSSHRRFIVLFTLKILGTLGPFEVRLQ